MRKPSRTYLGSYFKWKILHERIFYSHYLCSYNSVKFYCSRIASLQVYFDAMFVFKLGGHIFAIYHKTESDINISGPFIFFSYSYCIKFVNLLRWQLEIRNCYIIIGRSTWHLQAADPFKNNIRRNKNCFRIFERHSLLDYA